jgi:hypothetical protein
VTNDDVRRVIGELEQDLATDDPGFVARIRHLQRSEAVATVSVFALLALGAMAVAGGLATAALEIWAVGILALVSAVVVDRYHRRVWRRSGV